MSDTDEITGMYEFLEAVEAVIKAADPAKRAALADTIDAYSEGEFADDFFWAVSPKAPAMLYNLMNLIDTACRPESKSKTRPILRLVDRKPEGSA